MVVVVVLVDIVLMFLVSLRVAVVLLKQQCHSLLDLILLLLALVVLDRVVLHLTLVTVANLVSMASFLLAVVVEHHGVLEKVE